ncbi:phosphopentomutase [[Clostridium] fimetarium]|uniref:Phosphopentomutase n=1 Tax=[Clostridium] fimetarium TaxID=99656 RepID=A0A1I0Q1S5_9FIRM|nr:phosphopentomutase [[Clostridium] fimetarium]SEW20739.1 phosphopentomutase [[Clostridium] fimetarium]
MIKRVIWIVLDSVGMGELPDADKFGDVGSDTIGNTSIAVGGLKVPNMVRIGLGNIDGIHNVDYCNDPIGCFGRLAEISNGKDTTVGHWEMTGIYSANAFPTYPNGFSKDILDKFIELTGVKGILGNCTASGTDIIKKLGDEHVKTGFPIIYTSADSVFQIAAHESVFPIEEQYKICRIAREILQGENAVARVIARPFIGANGAYERTSNRRDFSLKPPFDNVLNRLKDNGYDVIGIGKIEDIFAKEGITKAIHTADNQQGIDVTIDYINQSNKGLIFTNLVEFDSKWGHRNDFAGYANGLKEFDERLPDIMNSMREDDILVITADHGCDPTTPSTDHSREYVPLLIYGANINKNINLGTGKTFANIGQTVADIFNLEPLSVGISLLNRIQ